MCGCGVVDRDLGFDNDGGSRLPLQIPMATGSPMATTSASKTLTNRFPVRVVAAEKKEKQKQTLIATVSDRIDECPQDCEKSVPGSCGGGEEAEAEAHSDSDCFSDCIDEYPHDCEKKVPGAWLWSTE
jgi:hypothetical protein